MIKLNDPALKFENDQLRRVRSLPEDTPHRQEMIDHWLFVRLIQAAAITYDREMAA